METPLRPTIVLALDPAKTLDGTWKTVIDEVRQLNSAPRVGLASFGPGTNSGGSYNPDLAFMDFLGGWDLLSTKKSAEAIRQFHIFSTSGSFQRFRFAALKLLNRRDLTGTFRFLEREVFVENAVMLAMTVVLRRKPSVVVFDVTPHLFMPFVFLAVSEWLGVKTLHFSPSPVSPSMLPKTSFGQSFSPRDALVANSKVAKPLIKIARESVTILETGIDPSYMKHQMARDRHVTSPMQRVKSLASIWGWLFKERFPESFDFGGHSRHSSFLLRGLKVLLIRSLQETLRRAAGELGSVTPRGSEFALFALHYEPERTSIPEGFPIDSQTMSICQARALLPPDHQLIVKEHYSQQSAAKRGFIGRSPLFYDLISSLDGTFFAPTKARLTDLLPGASCVFTLTGTIAIEAVLRGVPVAYFGNPWWEGMPGTFRIQDGVTFETIRNLAMPTSEQVKDFVVDLTAHSMIPGLAGENISTVESRLGPLPAGFFEAEGESIASCISAML